MNILKVIEDNKPQYIVMEQIVSYSYNEENDITRIWLYNSRNFEVKGNKVRDITKAITTTTCGNMANLE